MHEKHHRLRLLPHRNGVAFFRNRHEMAIMRIFERKRDFFQQFAFWPPFMRSGWNPTLQKPTQPLFSAMEGRLPRRPFLEKRP